MKSNEGSIRERLTTERNAGDMVRKGGEGGMEEGERLRKGKEKGKQEERGRKDGYN